MGLPINKIIVATNENTFWIEFLKLAFIKVTISQTLSPSMDIQVASNFERLLFDLLNKDPKKFVSL